MVAVVAKRRKKVRIGPEDHGKRMSLDDFDRAVPAQGYLYELNKGVVEVSDVPKLKHGRVVAFLRRILALYEDAHPDRINYMASGAEAKLLSEPDESERHPDWLIYLSPPPADEDHPWSRWVPEIVIEVVSESSVRRDYEEKPGEYLNLGVREYWIIDPLKQIITLKTRWRGIWKDRVLKPGQSYETMLLPGFKLEARKVLGAGK